MAILTCNLSINIIKVGVNSDNTKYMWVNNRLVMDINQISPKVKH